MVNAGRSISRRQFLTTAAIAPLTLRGTATPKIVPVGLEMYSVRDELARDLPGTLTAVAGMGYEVVEFYAPYFQWTNAQAQQIRRQMNDLGLACKSTHNGEESFTPDGLKRAVELNRILGSRYIVMAGSAPLTSLAGWRALCDRINGLV